MENFILGTNLNPWEYEQPVFFAKDRTIPLWVVGASGTGKSTLLERMAIHDAADNGMTFLDPHGTSVRILLDYLGNKQLVPHSRQEDVIFFSPLAARPVGFNPLAEIDPQYRSLVASQMVSIFAAQWGTGFMDRAQSLLKMAIAALLDYPNANFLHVEKLLTAPIYWDEKAKALAPKNSFILQLVPFIQDPLVRKFWHNIYPFWQQRYRNEAVEPVLNKLRSFLSPHIRAVLCQQPKMDIATVIQRKQILLCDLSVGELGETESTILGALLFGKIFWTKMAMPASPPHYLYYDEAAASNTLMASALSQARKYQLSLILANQYISQFSPAVQDGLKANTDKIVFRCSADDAASLAREFPAVANDRRIVNLNNYECFTKFGTRYTNLKTADRFDIPESKARERILQASARFGRSRDAIDSYLRRILR